MPGMGLGDEDRDESTRAMGRWPLAHPVGEEVGIFETNK